MESGADREMIIKDSELLLLKAIFNAVPTRTPKRIEYIHEWIKSQDWKGEMSNGKDVVIDACDGFASVPFACTISHVVDLDNFFGPPNGNKVKVKDDCIVLIPETFFCCKKSIKIDGRPAELSIYSTDGVKKAKSFHGKCKCGKTFYKGFSHDKAINIRSFSKVGEYFIFGSGVGFTVDLLERMIYQVFLGAVSFESCANIYNATHKLVSSPEALNPHRLEAAFFVYQICKYTPNIQWHRTPKSKELELEKIAAEHYPIIRDAIDGKWLNHICDEIGCKNRFVVIDGNEKLFRVVCNEEDCFLNPVRGNQHVKPSKKCNFHRNGCEPNHDGNSPQQYDVEGRLELLPVTRSMTKYPEVVISGMGCKKEDNVERFFNRSAGMLYIFRPCGIRLTHSEMIKHESLTQVYIALVHCFGVEPANELIRGIVYDRACDLKPFLDKLSQNGDMNGERYALLEFIVDIFHVEKHTLPKCTLGKPECLYHPHLEKFDYLKGMNTEVAEQSFSKINPHKFSTRKMCYAKRLLFLNFLDNTVNEQITLKRSN